MVHSPDLFFSPENSNMFSLRVRLFCMALVGQLGDDSWCVQLAAIWHWYLPLCIYIIFFNFVLRLSIPSVYFSGIDKLDGMVDDTNMS